MDSATVKQIALMLLNVEEKRIPIPPISETFYGVTIRDAYEIQKKIAGFKKTAGKVAIGKKLGATSQAIRKQLMINEPCYGYLFDSTVTSEYESISLSELICPRIEAEIAFFLGKDLKGPGITIPHVLEATAAIAPILEVIDSRFENWKVNVEDAIADNAMAGRVVLSSQLSNPWNKDLKTMGVVLEKNGKYLDSAAGAAVMGHPALAVAWLANKLSEYGDYLKAGEIILPGSFIPAYEIRLNDHFQAHFSQLGSVGITFVE